jgi:hypothetical protein
VIATGFDGSSSSAEGEQSFFRQTSHPKPVERLSGSDQSYQQKEPIKSVGSATQERYVYTKDVDVDVPAFMRRDKNSR